MKALAKKVYSILRLQNARKLLYFWEFMATLQKVHYFIHVEA